MPLHDWSPASPAEASVGTVNNPGLVELNAASVAMAWAALSQLTLPLSGRHKAGVVEYIAGAGLSTQGAC